MNSNKLLAYHDSIVVNSKLISGLDGSHIIGTPNMDDSEDIFQI